MGYSVLWRDHGRTVRGSDPCRNRGFCSSPKCPGRLWGPPSPQFSAYLGLLPGGEAARSWRNYWPSSAQFKNEWCCTPAPSICLYGLDRENFFLKDDCFGGSYFCLLQRFWILCEDLMASCGPSVCVHRHHSDRTHLGEIFEGRPRGC